MNTEQAMKDWLHRRITPDMRRTAEEWYDGLNSAMYRLWASTFRDDVEIRWTDYRRLATEAATALDSLSPDLEVWRPRLEELKQLGEDVQRIMRLLGRMKTDAEQLINLGVYDQEINGVVQGAVYQARDKRRRERTQMTLEV